MNNREIKQELNTILGLPVNGNAISVRKVKVSYQNRYVWQVASRSVNLWLVKDDIRRVYPGYMATSAVQAYIPVGQ